MSKCCSCGIYDENCEHCEHRDAEIARLTAEVERMQALGEQSMIVMEAASRTIDAYKAVVDAARFFVRLMQPQSEDFDYLHDEIARKTALGQLEREVRALDGEP